MLYLHALNFWSKSLQVDTLLETFSKDAGITLDEVQAAIANMKRIDAIKEVFQVGKRICRFMIIQVNRL